MGLFGDITGTSLKARFATYANKEHLHPRERIRTFLSSENPTAKLGTTDWTDMMFAIFDFARDIDARGEIEFYAAATVARAAFQHVGTTCIDLLPNAPQWRIQLIIFEQDVRASTVPFVHYMGGSVLNHYPGFPQQWDLSNILPVGRLKSRQSKLLYRRYAHRTNGQITYIPLYDDESPVMESDMAKEPQAWDSKLT